MKQELGNLMAEDPHQETINLLNYRLNAVTVERDEWKAKFIKQNKDLGCEMMDPNGTIWDYAKKLQTELAAVTEQRDQYKAALQSADNHNHEIGTKLEIVTEQRDEAREELAELKEEYGTWWAQKRIAIDELKEVTEQRDRLAEALRKAISWGDSASHHILYRQNINWTYLNEAREALQSLNQPTQ